MRYRFKTKESSLSIEDVPLSLLQVVKQDISRGDPARNRPQTNPERSATLKAQKAERRLLARREIYAKGVQQVPLSGGRWLHSLQTRILNATRTPPSIYSNCEPFFDDSLNDPDLVPKGFRFISLDEYQKIAADSSIFMLEVEKKVQAQLDRHNQKNPPVPDKRVFKVGKKPKKRIFDDVAGPSTSNNSNGDQDMDNTNEVQDKGDAEDHPPSKKKAKVTLASSAGTKFGPRQKRGPSRRAVRSQPVIQFEEEERDQPEEEERDEETVPIPIKRIGPPQGAKKTLNVEKTKAKGKGKGKGKGKAKSA